MKTALPKAHIPTWIHPFLIYVPKTTKRNPKPFAMLLAVARRVVETGGHCPVTTARAAIRAAKEKP